MATDRESAIAPRTAGAGERFLICCLHRGGVRLQDRSGVLTDKGTEAWHPGLYGRLYSGCKFRADSYECGADGPSQRLHGGDTAKSDQSNHEGVFDQILAFVAVQQTAKQQV